MRRTLGVVALVLAAACAPTDSADAGAAVETTDYMAAANAAAQTYMAAFNAKDAAGVAAHYTDDAVEMRPDSTSVVGRAAIEAEQAANFAGPVGVQLTITPTEATGSGEWSWATGDVTAVVTVPEAPGPITSTSKYLSISRRSADGSWKIHRLIWNENTAARPGM